MYRTIAIDAQMLLVRQLDETKLLARYDHMIVLHLFHQRFLNRFSYQITKKKTSILTMRFCLAFYFYRKNLKRYLTYGRKRTRFLRLFYRV